jgi:hypothetical protein
MKAPAASKLIVMLATSVTKAVVVAESALLERLIVYSATLHGLQ